MTKLLATALAALLITTPIAFAKDKSGGGGSKNHAALHRGGHDSGPGWYVTKHIGKNRIGGPFTLPGIEGRIVKTLHYKGGEVVWITDRGTRHIGSVYRRAMQQ